MNPVPCKAWQCSECKMYLGKQGVYFHEEESGRSLCHNAPVQKVDAYQCACGILLADKDECEAHCHCATKDCPFIALRDGICPNCELKLLIDARIESYLKTPEGKFLIRQAMQLDGTPWPDSPQMGNGPYKKCLTCECLFFSYDDNRTHCQTCKSK